MTQQERTEFQTAVASESSKKYIAQLKSGEIQPITRYTEPVVEINQTPEEKLMDAILRDPLRQHVFLRLASAEQRLHQDNLRVLKGEEPIEDTEALTAVVALLGPAFNPANNFEWTEESAAQLLLDAEELNPIGLTGLAQNAASMPTPETLPALTEGID